MRYLVILDDGHGISPATNGKRTPIFPDGTFMHENDFNSEVVMMIYDNLKDIPEVDVSFTAEEKYDVSLDKRIARANQAWRDHQEQFRKENSKCILISVHANAYGDGKTFNTAKGVSTFCCSSPPAERVLAETIHKHLKGGTTQVDRGVQEVCFDILRGNMTSCLVECAFMTNLEEANLLKQEEFRQECADEITKGILEYFGIEQEKEVETNKGVRYKKYGEDIHELRGNPTDLAVEIVDKRIWDITEFTNMVNGTFYWYNLDGTTYPTSILVIDGKIIKDEANHFYNFGCPQNVFIVYRNGKVEMKKIYFAHKELDYKNIQVAVGVVGLRDTTNPNFKYDPKSEGFKKDINRITGKVEDQSGVLAKRNKTVIGWNERLNKVYLLVVRNITHGDLIELISDNSTGEEYHIAGSLDGGDSTLQDALGEYVFEGNNNRRINNIVRFKNS